MNTYQRILRYAGRFRMLSFGYFLATFLATFFGLINFSLLIPVLKVLFNQTDIQAALCTDKPCFQLRLSFFTELFNYYFMQVIATKGRVQALYWTCSSIVVFIFFANTFRYLCEMIIAKIRTNVVYHLRAALFSHMMHLPLAYFTHQKKGTLLATLTSDVQEVEHAVADMLKVFLREPVTISCFISILLYMSAKLTIFALFFLPIGGILIATLIKNIQQWGCQSQDSISKLMHLVEEMVRGIRMIKSFGTYRYAGNRFQQENAQYVKISFTMALKQNLASPLSEWLGVGVVTMLLAYGGKLVLVDAASLSASTFITYIIIFSQALVPIKSLAKSASHIQRGLAAAKRIFTLLDLQPASPHTPHLIQVKQFNQAITFQDVSFTYEDKPVLHQLNFTIEKGKTIALVGSSGGGKSTLVDLIGRLYESTTGVILFDGIPVTHCDVGSLSQLIGTVSQEPILFHDTVWNNIAFGRPVSEQQVLQAAHIAHAHAFISELPQGYQTVVGDQGNKLSLGQKQRITIARAILTNPPILILDEATSSLDSASEQLVQLALDKILQEKTSIVVAHRLSTIQHADTIIVIEGGKIVEQGTHPELMQQAGWYKRLHTLQQLSL